MGFPITAEQDVRREPRAVPKAERPTSTRPPSEISEGLQAQQKVNENLHELINALETKLDPILAPGEPSKNSAEAQPPHQTALGSELARNYYNTAYAGNRLTQLLARIQL